MIEVTSSIKIDESEIQYDFIRASGPGGQNVNKVSSSVQLRFDVRNSPSLDSDIKERLVRLAGKRITEAGILIIEAKRYRAQERNRQDAVERLKRLICQASLPPRERRKTRPTAASRRRRLAEKRRRSDVKRLRQSSSSLED